MQQQRFLKNKGTAEYKIKTQRSKPSPWVRHIQERINDIRKERSGLVEIKRDNRRVQNTKSQIA
jgi:hypothetical protein